MKLSSMFSSLSLGINRDFAIDLGTANTLVYAKGKGIILNEPSVVAIIKEKGYDVPYLFGEGAKMMIGKTPHNIVVSRPLQDGVIADFGIAEEMLRNFIKVCSNNSLLKPGKIIMCVPYGSTAVDRRAIQNAGEKSGASVWLLEEPMAAAIGANLPVCEPAGSMVLDIGGGTAEAAVISMGGIVYCSSIKCAGDKMDAAIVSYVRQEKNMLIGQSTAESIKKAIGSAYQRPGEEDRIALIRGRDLVSGTPREVKITSSEMHFALADVVQNIIGVAKKSLEEAPPELAADIVDRGIVLTGGGSQLQNLDVAISLAVGLPVFPAVMALDCVALGAGKVLYDFDKYSHVLFTQN